MISLVQDKLPDLKPLCVKHRVRRLSLFGSAAAGGFDPAHSDVDLLVEFRPMPPAQHADCYFGLMEDLQALLGARIDLVEPGPIRNPYFRREIERTQVTVYDAG